MNETFRQPPKFLSMYISTVVPRTVYHSRHSPVEYKDNNNNGHSEIEGTPPFKMKLVNEGALSTEEHDSDLHLSYNSSTCIDY